MYTTRCIVSVAYWRSVNVSTLARQNYECARVRVFCAHIERYAKNTPTNMHGEREMMNCWLAAAAANNTPSLLALHTQTPSTATHNRGTCVRSVVRIVVHITTSPPRTYATI